MTLKHATEPLKNQSKSLMHICFRISVTCWTGKDSDQTGIESWKRTNRPKGTSPLRGKCKSSSSTKLSREEMAKTPCTYSQQGKCRRGDKCFYKHESAAAPTKDPNEPTALLQRKRPVQKLRHALPKGMLALQQGKGCQRLQRLRSMSKSCCVLIKSGIRQDPCYR